MRRAPPKGPALLVAVALTCAACERFDATPREVARSFWTTVQDGDLEAARALSADAPLAELRELAERHPLELVSFGEILRGESRALVETTAILRGDTGELVFQTHLVRRGADWRVDVAGTRRDLTRTALASSVEQLRDSLRQGAESLAEQIEQGALEFSEALREALEGLQHPAPQSP